MNIVAYLKESNCPFSDMFRKEWIDNKDLDNVFKEIEVEVITKDVLVPQVWAYSGDLVKGVISSEDFSKNKDYDLTEFKNDILRQG